MDETALVQRAKTEPGGPAFTELVKRHQSTLRYSLRQMTGWDEGLAEDIAQETFLRVYQSLDSFHGGAKFSTWLYRIATNLLMSHYRKRSEQVSDDGKLPETGSVVDASEELHRDLAIAMRQLSHQQRIALHLSLHRELSNAEVAEAMGCPLGTAKSHLQRGREKLQQLLSDWR